MSSCGEELSSVTLDFCNIATQRPGVLVFSELLVLPLSQKARGAVQHLEENCCVGQGCRFMTLKIFKRTTCVNQK